MRLFKKAVIRTSAYPFEFIKKLYTLDLDEAISILMADPFFVRALTLASPELLKEVQRIEEITVKSKQLKLKQSVLKYAARIASRPTPFGMFSGLTTIPIKEEDLVENIQISEHKNFSRYYRLDMNFSHLFATVIAKNPIVQKYTQFYPNTTLYSLGEHYRLIIYKTDEKRRKYDLISIEKNDYVTRIIEQSKNGVYLSTLIQELVDEGIETLEVEEFIRDLVDSQLIISELEPSTLGPEIEFQILEKLKNILPLISDITKQQFINQNINYLSKLIERLDQLNDSNSTALDYENVINYIKTELPLEIKTQELDDKYLIQCNTEIALNSGQINTDQLKLVEKAISIVNHFNDNETPRESERLKKFRSEFEKRYDGKMLPLVEVLDVETGIGYGSKTDGSAIDIAPLIQDIILGYNPPSKENITWNKKITPFWLNKIQEAKENKTYKIELTDKDLSQFEAKPLSFSSTYTAKVGLFKKEGEDVLLFDFYGGGTAASWLGRFCNGNRSIDDLTQEIATYEAEQQDHVMVAEINHLPESRLGNIIQRPQHRNFHINYLAGYNSPADETNIPLEDLMLGMERGKLILVSKKRNKKIYTYHSNAFNTSYPGNLPMFQFLADLQEVNNCNGFGLQLTLFHRFHTFIPRISYQNIILYRASWQFKKSEFAHLQKLSRADLITEVKTFVETHSLPQFVMLKQGDNELLIDLKNMESVSILLQEAKSTPTIQLVEFMLNEFESAVKNEKGEQFNNELLLAYGMPTEKKQHYDFTTELNHNVIDRFSPGSEWMYYKVYLGIKNADKLLMELNELTTELLTKGKIDQWFFIRYYDTSEHLRIRFRVNNLKHIGIVLQHIHSFFNDFNQRYGLDNFVMDTYQRELSRYGYQEIESFEKIFQFDSEMCLQLIRFFDAYEKSDLLWLAAMYSTSTYCGLFRLDTDQKITFFESIENSFRKEFSAVSATTKSIGNKYNLHKTIINELFLEQKETPFYGFRQLIDARNKRCAPIVSKLLAKNPDAANQFLNSVIHMSINRMFRSNQRMYEFITYSFLKKITTTMKYMNKRVAG